MNLATLGAIAAAACVAASRILAAETATNSLADSLATKPASPVEQLWNWHLQNTDIIQATPGFPAKYSGPNSLNSQGEIRDTVSLDLMAGLRLWHGADAHVDGMMWQGFGLSKTRGVDGFPNGEAFRLGTTVPNVDFSRVFIRQTIGLGGEQETVEDDQLHLAGKHDISRLTLTLGKMSAKDIFDNNAYANDPRTQFMNWGLMANEAWDYPADSLGYITGFAAELNQPPMGRPLRLFSSPPRLQRNGAGFTLSGRLVHGRGVGASLHHQRPPRCHPLARLPCPGPHGQFSRSPK